MGRPLIGVFPRAAWEGRARLFAALADALDVRFEGRQPGEDRDLDAVVAWTGDASTPTRSPRLVLSADREAGGAPGPVRLYADPDLDRRLRDRVIGDPAAAMATAAAPLPGRPLAGAGGRALWSALDAEMHDHRALAGPDELGVGESLGQRLRDGRFLALLPLVELARRAHGHGGFLAPPPRACFVFDDPNLHWPSYGHVRFAELAGEAERHDYHVSMATVPVDGWFTHPRARDLFAAHPRRLSLLVHGNEHVRRELGRPRRDREALALAVQALHRVRALERRTGLRVGRVMAPPHGACTEPMAGALFRAGFEALTINHPYPWPSRGAALDGWRPATFVARGLPAITRWPLGAPVGELALRAYLGQPLVLYGHHTDLSAGTGVLGELAARLAELGPLRWESPERIARSNCSLRRVGGVLHVRMHARRVDVAVPDGVSELVVELPGHPAPEQERLHDGAVSVVPGQPLRATAGQTARLCLERVTPDPGAASPGASRRARPWPVLRRGLVEARDRSLPLVGAARRRDG